MAHGRPDPIRHWKMGYGARMFNVLLGGPPEVILGLAILSARTPIASMYSLSSTHAGGGLLWISTEFVTIAAFIPIFWQWMRSDQRAAARADAQSTAQIDGGPSPTAVPALAAATGPSRQTLRNDWADWQLTTWEATWQAKARRVPYPHTYSQQAIKKRVSTALSPGPTARPTNRPRSSPSPQHTDQPTGSGLSTKTSQPPLPTTSPDETGAASPGRNRRRTRRNRRRKLQWLIGGTAILTVVVVAGPAVFFHLIEGNAPARLSLPAVDVGNPPTPPGPISGTWTVTAGSQAGYRVQEILFGQHHTAVGRTSRITGYLIISGATVTAAEFNVDMAAIKSDQPSRDAQFNGFIMKTYKYGQASFHLTQPIELDAIPPPGDIVTEQATGQLTLRGNTRVVTFPLHAERVANGIDINAAIPITFSSWHIPNPSFAVAQVGSTGQIEVLLQLAPQSK